MLLNKLSRILEFKAFYPETIAHYYEVGMQLKAIHASDKKQQLQQVWKTLAAAGFFDYGMGGKKPWTESLAAVIGLSLVAGISDAVLSAVFQLSGIQAIIAHQGTAQQKTEFLEPLVQGTYIAAHCLTEEKGGTDNGAMLTCAKQTKHGQWLLNGSKTYICNVPYADLLLVYAKTAETGSIMDSLSCFLCTSDQPGISMFPPFNKIGLNEVPMGTIKFEDVLLNKQQLLGKPGMGFSLLQFTTTYERLIIPAVFLGRMLHFYFTVEAEKISNKLFLGDLYADMLSLFLLLKHACESADHHPWKRGYLKLGAVVKLKLSEAYLKMTNELLRCPLTNQQRDAEYPAAVASWIYSGTNDALRHMLTTL